MKYMANDEPSMHHWFQMSAQFLMLSISFVAGVQTQQASEPKAHQQPELTLNAGQQIADAEIKSNQLQAVAKPLKFTSWCHVH